MIDIHSHILPGIDDGAKDIETSLKMLKLAEASGTEIIIATPHYIKNRYENTYEAMEVIYNKLKLEAKVAGINIEILLGQEVMLEKYSLQLCKEKKLRGLNDSRYMLIEFPMDKLPSDAMDLIYELRLQNITPILAHPERYIYIMEDITQINDFAEEGCLFQVNTGSLQGIFGKKVQSIAAELISHGMVNFIASDAHSINKRCPSLTEGFREAENIAAGITEKISYNHKALLENKELKIEFNKLKKKKNFFDFLKK